MLSSPMTRWTAALVAFAAGALLALSFAPFNCWPVIFISLPLFYLLLQRAETVGQALLRGFSFGYGFFIAGTWWIGNALLVDADKFAWLLPFSVLGLSALMALWFMLLGLLAYYLRARMSPFLFALLWVVVEILRSVGIFGFPWNLLGYISLASLELAQMASIFGVYGLSLMLSWLGLLPLCWLMPASRRRRCAVSSGVLLLVTGSMIFGAVRLSQPGVVTDTLLRVVQPNVPQEVKGTRTGQQVAANFLGLLTTQKPEGSHAPDVVIWPETAYPFTVREGQAHPLPALKLLLTGAVRAEGGWQGIRLWNSVLAMDDGGQVIARYDKHQLVPFGEFVPLRNLLSLDKITPGDSDFSRGNGAQTLTVAGLPPFSPLICYEVIFSWMAVDASHRPAWMLNLTNDAWYGDSPGPYQHFAMARMRAIEQGLPLVRAANSGISAVIDGRGRVVSSLKLNYRGKIDVYLPAADSITFYGKYTLHFLWLMLLSASVIYMFPFIPRAKDK